MNNKIAIYLRLSLSDGDLKKGSKDESNSIENQRLLLHSYIEKQDDLSGEIVEYVDDGYTGTNFNRPAFQKMIIDLKQGEIKTIVVKDLSRLPFYKRGSAAIYESNSQEKIPCRAFQGIGCLCRIREILPGRKRWKAAIAEISEKAERRTDARNRGEEKSVCSLEGRIQASGNCIG